jgi:hypothetical protein
VSLNIFPIIFDILVTALLAMSSVLILILLTIRLPVRLLLQSLNAGVPEHVLGLSSLAEPHQLMHFFMFDVKAEPKAEV